MSEGLSTQRYIRNSGAELAAGRLEAKNLSQGGIETPMHQPTAPLARLTLMGEAMDPVTPVQVLGFVARQVERRRKGVIANHNLHSLYLTPRTPRMADFYDRADLIQIDSVPLILWGKLLGHPIELSHRSTYLDWRDQFWQLAAERGWRVFLLGSAPGVADAMADRVRTVWPQLIVETQQGYFDHAPDSAANTAVVERINAFRPDVVLVGMGMPLQERWIAENMDRLTSGVLFSVGGAFDYEAGVQTPAPRWLGMMGLEWLFRFAMQPRRLFRRYFFEPWSLAGALLDDLRRTPQGRHARVRTPLSTLSEH